MENEVDMQDEQQGDFEQEFIAQLKSPSTDATQSLDKKKNRILMIVLAILIGVLLLISIVFGILLANSSGSGEENDDEALVGEYFEAETSILKILVAPSSARVVVGGEEYINGEYEVAPGEYDYSVKEDGFETFTGTVLVENNHKSLVLACLQPLAGNEYYYENNADERQICQSVGELRSAAVWDQNTLMDVIFKYTPYHNHEEGYYVDPYLDEDGNVIVELTFKDCSQTEAVLEERAYAWMREQGFNPVDYTFEKTWDCED